MADRVRLSKFLALLLRHEADKFGLTLDADGFTDTDAVWEQIDKRYPDKFTYSDLLAVVEGDQTGKKRYEIQGRRIRALFGHSAVREVSYPSAEPPDLLYHGTTREALDAIRREGLSAQRRQYVHLTVNPSRAQTVAQRHGGNTVMLIIHAGRAYRDGITFYHPETEHYLAESIPPEYIEVETN